MDMDIPSTLTPTMAESSSMEAGVFLCSSGPRMHSISMPVPYDLSEVKTSAVKPGL